MKHSFFLDFAILTVTSFALMACVHDGAKGDRPQLHCFCVLVKIFSARSIRPVPYVLNSPAVSPVRKNLRPNWEKNFS